MSPAKDNANYGWMVTDSPVTVGPDEWLGQASLRVRRDIGMLDGKINIERLPTSVSGACRRIFRARSRRPEILCSYMTFNGNAQGIKANGAVTDPSTRQAYRF